MSTTSTMSAPRASDTSAPVSVTARGLWRGGRGFVALGLLVVLVAVATALVTGTSTEGRRLDPADTTLEGSKALARLLADRGVRVERVTTVDEVERLDGPDSQLLVYDTWSLAQDDLERLAGTQADRLIIGVNSGLPLLAPGITPRSAASLRSREPGCALPAAARAGSAYIGGVTFDVPGRGALGCYAGPEGPSLVRTFGPLTGPSTVTVAGDGSFMTNQRLGEDGNAALALNLAGAKPVLIWLVPGDTPAAVGTGDATPADLIPAGVIWGVVQLVIALLVVALWRGRRLGPVVVEKLPVVVRAAETAEGRGRLYRARRARDRASAALRAASASRLTPRLGLPADATPAEIVAAAALKSGRDAVWVRSVMYGPIPADDAALVALAGHLDTLERQVRES
ncbi:DUF4350 domain-containing protein [Sphaerisporangium sp. NPDC051011]|uniref:DUF4350 domain-containing protein n=1 Tax=Sphaerisporangium sp. NPDC051011 TaxID=3155792 RepID=UPI0033EB01F6